MAKNETLHIRVNEDVKLNAEKTLSMLGITISEAVNMLLCQINLTGGLPFSVSLPAPERIVVNTNEDINLKLKEAENDIAKGNVISSTDFLGRIRDKYEL